MPDALPTAPPIDLRSRSVACAIVLVAAAVCLWPAVFRSKQEQMLQQAADALLDRRFDEAEELAGLVLATDSESAQALLIAGEAATGAHRPQAALGYFTRVPDDGGMSSVLGLAGQAERLIRLGRAAEAERVLRRLLELAPDRLAAHDQLVYLLETQARGWEALPSLARLIQNGQFSGDHLLMTGSTEWMYLRDSRFVDECRKAVPADALPLMVAARQALRENRYAEAVTQLE
ncbi:MAG: hypothetical protein KY476_25600, partial [Planctomycetes bacterium]|nr:hypothetical protein [Planctomycetota bacterium]